jgi:hypothetical protein
MDETKDPVFSQTKSNTALLKELLSGAGEKEPKHSISGSDSLVMRIY